MRDQLLKVIVRYPNLAYGGLNCQEYERYNGSSFEHDRKLLYDAIEEFALAVEWLSTKRRQRSCNLNYVCGHIKDDIRKWANHNGNPIQYVSQGATIAAAIALGFRYRSLPFCRFKAAINIANPRPFASGKSVESF